MHIKLQTLGEIERALACSSQIHLETDSKDVIRIGSPGHMVRKTSALDRLGRMNHKPSKLVRKPVVGAADRTGEISVCTRSTGWDE